MASPLEMLPSLKALRVFEVVARHLNFRLAAEELEVTQGAVAQQIRALEADLRGLVDRVLARWGRIDVLVNSAGHGPRGPVLEISDDDWHRGMDTYLLNVVRASRLVVPTMQQQQSGAIINISTAWAVEPSGLFPTSGVFRAGLSAFTKIFADTYAADNIRMNNVLPGWIDSLPATDERRDSVPMQRYGRSDEIAATIAFLASEGAGYITGQNLRVDGGLTRSL